MLDQEDLPVTDREHLSAGVEATAEGRSAAGENQGLNATFSADQIASAFEVAIDRVHNAMQGEFNLGPDGQVDSKQAQQLSEVLLGDQPQAVQMAATMKLGGYTPRPDDAWGFGDTVPGEESDRLSDETGAEDGDSVSPRSSYAPSTNPA